MASGFISRLMYSAIDHIDDIHNKYDDGNKTIWWVILIGSFLLTITIVVYLLKTEKCETKKKEGFATAVDIE